MAGHARESPPARDRSLSGVLLAAALLLLVPIGVDAQPAVVTHVGGRGTLGVGVVADIDDTWGSATPSKKAGIYATAAIDVLPYVRVRLDLDVPAWANSLTIIEFATSRSVESREQRMITLSPLVELHGQVSKRVRLSALVGIASGWRQSRVQFETDSTGPGGVWEHQQANYSDSRSAIWGGL